jgi:hypothetical protein
MWDTQVISPQVHVCEQHMPWRWKWLGNVVKLTQVMMKELIANETWHWVMWSRWRRSWHDLAWWASCKSEGQVGGFGAMDRVAVKLKQDLAPMDEGNGESKWSQDRWTNMITWWYDVDHIIVDHVGACVASTLKEMEWNAQGKGITYGISFHRSLVCREVDDRVQDRWPYYQERQTCLHIGHLVPLEWSNFASSIGLSGVVSWVANPLENECENANTHTHGGVHLMVLAHLQRRWNWSWCGSTRWWNGGEKGLTEWTGLWSRSDRTLGSSVQSVVADSMLASVFDRTLALKVNGCWLCASGQADVRWCRSWRRTGRCCCIRSLQTGRVRSCLVPYWKRSDAEGPASGQC